MTEKIKLSVGGRSMFFRSTLKYRIPWQRDDAGRTICLGLTTDQAGKDDKYGGEGS